MVLPPPVGEFVVDAVVGVPAGVPVHRVEDRERIETQDLPDAFGLPVPVDHGQFGDDRRGRVEGADPGFDGAGAGGPGRDDPVEDEVDEWPLSADESVEKSCEAVGVEVVGGVLPGERDKLGVGAGAGQEGVGAAGGGPAGRVVVEGDDHPAVGERCDVAEGVELQAGEAGAEG